MFSFKEGPAIAALARSVNSSDGVVFVPALAGLGAPHWNPHARGIIRGITGGTTMAHLARATLEGIALQIDDILCWQDNLPGVACPEAWLRTFRNATVSQLAALHHRPPPASPLSAWVPSCFAHTNSMCLVPGGSKPPTEVQSTTLSEAFRAWLGGATPLLLDACGSVPGNESRPCNTGCTGCGDE